MATQDDELRLAELVAARLCHDLSGPIGGAVAGAELLADEEPADAETARLVADSVTAAAAGLRLLRAALGAGSQPFADAELAALAAQVFPESGATRLSWQAAPDRGGCDRAFGRVVLNLLMMVRDALPRGGRVAVTVDAAVPAARIAADGPRIAADDLAAALAATSPAGLGARGVQGYYAARLAAAAGRSIVLSLPAGGLELTVS